MDQSEVLLAAFERDAKLSLALATVPIACCAVLGSLGGNFSAGILVLIGAWTTSVSGGVLGARTFMASLTPYHPSAIVFSLSGLAALVGLMVALLPIGLVVIPLEPGLTEN